MHSILVSAMIIVNLFISLRVGSDSITVDAQELRQRGVSPEDIEAAIQMVFTTSDEFLNQDDDSEDNEGRWGMTKRTSDHLMEKARLQWGRGDSISPEARKRRMIGWLQRRGFNWSITTEVLKSLEALDKQNC